MSQLAERIARGLTGWRPAPDPGAVLRLEQILPIDPRRRLCLVRCGDRRLLLLTGGPNDVALGWLPPDDTPA